MNELQAAVDAVLEQQKQVLAPSTYYVRKKYLEHLVTHAAEKNMPRPCQELYDPYVSRATTHDLRFQLFRHYRKFPITRTSLLPKVR